MVNYFSSCTFAVMGGLYIYYVWSLWFYVVNHVFESKHGYNIISDEMLCQYNILCFD